MRLSRSTPNGIEPESVHVQRQVGEIVVVALALLIDGTGQGYAQKSCAGNDRPIRHLFRVYRYALSPLSLAWTMACFSLTFVTAISSCIRT